MEERNRLARDLHDSVSQKLFSLTFMTKGAEAVLKGQNEKVDHSLHEMRELAQGALKEMRTLIWRPSSGIRERFITSFKTVW